MEISDEVIALAEVVGVKNSPYMDELIKEIDGTPIVVSNEVKNGLGKWLSYDQWKVKEAILILVGINPSYYEFDWSQEKNGITWPTMNSPLFFYFWESNMEGYPPRPPENTDDELLYSFFEDRQYQHKQRKPRLELDIFHLLTLWERSVQNNLDIYPKKHFINWALEAGFEPTWYKWAIRHNLLLASEKSDISETLSTQGENSYRRSVRALATALIGTIPDKPTSKNIQQLTEILRDHGVEDPNSDRTWRKHLTSPD